jgi:ABC-type nitrate/sulfonate/bicarbonate transport system substrate-binding protein
VHGGCYQLFGGDRVRAVRDLKGQTAAVHYIGSGDHLMLSAMLAYVGINPQEVSWITGSALVAVFMLRRGRQSQLCRPPSCRHQARPSRDP